MSDVFKEDLLEMVGDILRKEREQQNISIQDVERETSIRALYISSIEEGKYDVIPGEVYLRGFIKTYANFLQLDANNILQLYKEEKAAQEPIVVPETENTVQSAQESLKLSIEKPSLREKMAEKRQQSLLYAKIAIIALVIISLGAIAYWIFGSSNVDKAPSTPPVTAKDTTQQQSTSANNVKPVPVVDKFVTYEAKYTDDCWSKVEVDGKTVLEETVKKGTVLKWQVEKNLVITAGNAGAVEVISNGKSLGIIGKPGEVITKNFAGIKTAP